MKTTNRHRPITERDIKRVLKPIVESVLREVPEPVDPRNQAMLKLLWDAKANITFHNSAQQHEFDTLILRLIQLMKS